MRINEVVRVLQALGAPYALIGAHAMAARGYPRATVDVDFLTTDRRVLDRAVWRDLEDAGAFVDPRRGDADDPLAGAVHIRHTDGSEIDIIVGRWSWEAHVVERAEVMQMAGAEVPVARTGDIILLKLAAGGYLDLRDAAALLASGDREAVVADVEAHIGEVRPDVRGAWETVLSETDG